MQKDSFEIHFFDKSQIIYDLRKKTFCYVGGFANTLLGIRLTQKLDDIHFLRAVFNIRNKKQMSINPIVNTILNLTN